MIRYERPTWIKKELEKDPSREKIITKPGANQRLDDMIESGSNKSQALDLSFKEDMEGKGVKKFKAKTSNENVK